MSILFLKNSDYKSKTSSKILKKKKKTTITSTLGMTVVQKETPMLWVLLHYQLSQPSAQSNVVYFLTLASM